MRDAKLHYLQLAIESNLENIERILGSSYKLTLLAKYYGPKKDADIALTTDTRENMLTVIDRFFPTPTSASPALKKEGEGEV